MDKKELRKIIESTKLNAIDIKFDRNYSTLNNATSKIGGVPDLPDGFIWPTFVGEGWEDEVVKERSMSFIAQVNLDEVKRYDKEHRLPRRGMLYFFYEMESQLWGFSPKHEGCSYIYYYDKELDNLKPTTLPGDIKKEYIIPEIKMSFSSRKNAPSYEEYFDNVDNWNEYDELIAELGMTYEDNNSKLLGYSDNVQGDMTIECELVKNGLECGDQSGWKDPRVDLLKKNKSDWVLLFQICSFYDDDFEFMLGDMGKLYFFIKKDDLKSKNFSNYWQILQCG